MYIIMDFCDKGPILDWDPEQEVFVSPWNDNQPVSTRQLRKIFRDIICGLEYLHCFNIVHRDIKPQNILISSDGAVKIADFG